MNIKIANRLEIDFDAVPQEVASGLAAQIEDFIVTSFPQINLHGTCSLLDEDSLEHEITYRAEQKELTMTVKEIRRLLSPVGMFTPECS